MLISKPYDRQRAVEYARRWALSRNPLFYDFTGGGGNCTNFVSQCLLAGSLTSDPSPTFGWYYIDIDNRAPAWTGVREFYEFMTGVGDFALRTERRGPFCTVIQKERVEIGDVVQLSNTRGVFYHSLIVSGFDSMGDILVCAQSNDALDRPLSSYSYAAARFLHVEGVNIAVADQNEQYLSLLEGRELPPTDQVYIPFSADMEQI